MNTVKGKIKILFVEDLESDFELAVRVLKKENLNFLSTRVETAEDMLSAFSEFNPDIIISDYSMPRFDGMKALLLTLEHRQSTPFIVLTGSMNEETAVKCLKAGATDYVIKERIKRLPFAVIEALERSNLQVLAQKAEQELVKSEERFRELAENAQDLIYRYEYLPTRRYTYVSPSSKKISGYTPQEYYNNPDLAYNLIHKDDRHVFQTFEDDLLKSNQPFELRLIRKDGVQIWVEQHNSLILNDKGELVAIEGFARDITERKLTEEALAENEKKYRLITENSSDVVWTSDLNLNLSYVSPSVERLFGYSIKEHLKISLEEKHPKESVEIIKKVFQEEIEKEKDPNADKNRSRIIEVEHYKKDGSRIWTEIKISFLRNDVGEITGLQGLTRDITERKAAEETIRNSEVKYRLLFENNPNPMWVYELNSLKFLAVNDIAVKTYGFSRKEFLSMTLEDIRPKEEITQLIKIIEGTTNAIQYSGPIVHQYKNGKQIFVDVTSHSIEFDGKDARIVVVHDITERVKSTQEIIEQRQLAQATLDSINANICVVDNAGEIITINKQWLNFALENDGDIQKVMVGVNYFKVCELAIGSEKKEANDFLAGIKQVLNGQSVGFEMEYDCHSPTQKRWFVGKVTPFEADFVKYNRVVISHTDITHRKLAESMVRESEERYSKFMNSTSDVAYIKDEDFRYVMVNKAGLKILKKSIGDVLGKTDFQLLEPQYANSYSLTDKEAIEKDQLVVSIEHIGNKIYETRKFPVKLNNDKKGVGCFIRDITEVETSKQQIEESEKKYRNLVENSLVGVYTTTINGEIIFANKAFANIVELNSSNDLISKDIRSFYKNEIDRDRFIEILNAKERIVNYEIELVTVKGNSKSVILSAIKSEVNLSGMILDITDRKKVELELIAKRIEIESQNEELLVAKQKAEESDQLKTAFLQNLSHEIRTPMNGIVGFTQLLKEGTGNFESNRQYLEMIERSGDRLMNIINDLVEISKIETGHISINISQFKINPILQELLLFHKKSADDKGVELKIGNFELEEEVIISTDKGKFYQIFSNLINNAIKFTSKGSVEFGYHILDDFIEFYIIDTGIGIKPENFSLIFERFRQIDTSISRGYEGAGIGLSISKAFVDKLNGSIWVESEWRENSSMPRGSTFKFTIPFNKEFNSLIKYIKMNNSANTPKGNQKVLVVEDDVVSRILLNEILKDLDMQITYARNGQEAVDALKAEPDFDLVLMDLKMPIMNGFEAVTIMRQMGFAKTIIAQTAYAGDDDRDKVMASGFNGFIAKPVKKEVLLETLKDIEDASPS
jgi:PAS domain S-box-containing protein